MKQNELKLKEVQFDYNLLAKTLLQQMSGSFEAVSLQIFVEEYIAFVDKNRAPKTTEGVGLVCKHLLSYYSPARNIGTIKLKDAECFLDSLKINAPKGVYNYHRTLRAMWNKGKQWNYVQNNPFAEIKLPRIQKVKQDYISNDDVNLIMESTKGNLIKDVILFAYNTGMRIGEIVQLRWSDVDIVKRLITVGSEHFTTKSKRIRYIPLTDAMVELLLKRKQLSNPNEKFVFSKSSDMPFTTDYFSKKFKAAIRNSNIEKDYCFHSLRHGFASRLAQQGVPIINISKLLGHSNIATTMIYSEVNPDDLRNSINKL